MGIFRDIYINSHCALGISRDIYIPALLNLLEIEKLALKLI